MRVLHPLAGAVLAALVLAPGLAHADVEVALFLEIDGTLIEGENPSTTLERENTIKVLSISNGIFRPRDSATGSLSGNRQHKPLTITKPVDKSTPLIFKAIANNEPVTRAEFRFFRGVPGGGEEHYYTILLESAAVSAASGVGGKGDDLPTEMVSFTYERITWTYEDGGVTHTDDWNQSGS